MKTDWELLGQYGANGDAEAFGELVRRHIGFVYGAARRQVGGDAEDVTQAVFILLSQKARGLKPRGTLTGWLFGATRLCCCNVRKVEARRRFHERGAAVAEARIMDMDAGEGEGMLDAGLASLGIVERDAVILRYMERKSFGETGQMLGLTEEAARKRVERGLEKLRQFFAKRGHGVGVGAIALMAENTSAVPAPAGLLERTLGAAGGNGIGGTGSAARIAEGARKMIQRTRMVHTMAAAVAMAAGPTVAMLGAWTVMGMERASAPGPVAAATVGAGGAANGAAMRRDAGLATLTAAALLDGWTASYGSLANMDVSVSSHTTLGESLAAVAATRPEMGRMLVTWNHVEMVLSGERYVRRASTSEKAFANANDVRMEAFDGKSLSIYTGGDKKGVINADARLSQMQQTTTMTNADGTQTVTTRKKAAVPYISQLLLKTTWFVDAADLTAEKDLGARFRNDAGGLLPGVSVRGKLEVVSGEACHVMERPLLDKEGKAAGHIAVWLAAERGFVPMKYEVVHGGDHPGSRMVQEVQEITQAAGSGGKQGIWYPARLVSTQYLGEKSFLIDEVIVHKFVPDPVVSDATFELAFPDGTEVFDQGKMVVYWVKVDGAGNRTRVRETDLRKYPEIMKGLGVGTRPGG